MRIFVICSVRGADEEYRNKLEEYVRKLESDGHIVHLPHRDTNQDAIGLEICKQNANAMDDSDEIHIFYNSKSQGTHFDMGVAFALTLFVEYKKLVVVENEKYGDGKSYPRMLDEWKGC